MSLTGEDDGQAVTIVDCDVLEAAKENVQPLATGRRVTALSALLATPHAQRESKLAATRNRLRINVDLAMEDEEGDPLEAYCKLVYWTLENYPQGHSAESGLLELLEEATRVLKDDRDGKWRSDLKYLKLWLLYASYVEKPTIVYKFLVANDIGTEFALLYEEHAAVLERDGRRKEADEVYALGIARKASPLDHLENRYRDFQKRMMSNTYLPAPEPVASTSSRPRQALATTSSSIPTSSSRQTSSRATPTLGANTTGLPSTASNSRLQIFVDPTGEQAQAAEANGTNEWNDLGTRKTRIKENVPEVKKMVGTTIKQAGKTKRLASGSSSGTAASGSTSKIVPFRDPGPGDMPPPSTVPPPSVQKKAQSTATKAPAKGFSVFVDDGTQSSLPPKKKEQEPAGKVPAARGFTIFVDDESKGAAAKGPSPVTTSASGTPGPSFTPFRDESADAVPVAAAVPIDESIMKIKKADRKAPGPTTEAEALRKDPLKNYALEDLDSLSL
ncbi:hypothetical protein CPC08DRAFT_703363 [Agrocybe pediades]|nr:hypothetical protein CPC08DRAFT_703363 [Agrocybe pediades]